MNVSHAGRGLGLAVAASLLLPLAGAAESAATRTTTGKSPTGSTIRPTTTTGKSGAGRGPLPDPVLLDGSTHPAEKKSEYGMVGDFELPGDENVRNGRVGGPQNQGQPPPQGGLPTAQPPTAGGGGQQPPPSGQPPQAGGSGQQPPGPENPNAAGNQVAGAGDPNAKPEGQQVAQLGGEGGQQQAGGTGERPPPVAIGDSAMRIQTPATSATVVGSQQQAAPNTQHHEKGTGTGGKGPTAPGGTNRVEKGRTIPAGL